jgi:hypothetical protein
VPLQTAVGFTATAGYLIHLLLDEIWSVDFEGRRLKKKFGSALSLRSSSIPATLLAYAVLLLLGVMTWEGVGGSRPEGLWSEHLGDVPQQWLEDVWGWMMSELERVL